jgi:mono/diheme cytochrome c family protein
MSPFRVRLASVLVVIGTCLSHPADANAQGLTPFSRRKAESLLKDHLPCLGCHKLNGDGGTIGPDLTTVRERRSPEYIASMIADPQKVVAGSAMPRIAMPDATRELITRYLGGTDRPEARGQRPDLPSHRPQATGHGPQDSGGSDLQQASGAQLYAKWCAACHGATGKGDGPNAANLPVKPAVHSSREAMSARPDDSLFDTIASGGAVMNRSPRMPPFGGTLHAAEIRELVRHIRTLCQCEGPSWSRNR